MQKQIHAKIQFKTDREDYTGNVYLSTGWVYLEELDMYIPRESIQQVKTVGQKIRMH